MKKINKEKVNSDVIKCEKSLTKHKRVGLLKKDHPDFGISLETFNSIPIEGFDL